MNLYEPPPRTVYLPAFQDGGIHSHFALRTSVSPLSIADDVRRAIQDELKGVRVAKVTTLTDQLNASIANERLVASVAGGFGATGAALAGVGLYGLLAYSVARRRREIGIRIALGATTRNVTTLVCRSAVGLVCAGVMVGTPLALWSKRFAVALVGVPTDMPVPLRQRFS